MANIYEAKNEDLYKLLENAIKDNDGATVLIPDLQRPFVWTPSQVTLLLDSLIRGWPFGTLLMWKIGKGQIQHIPHRQFWKIVDRTVGASGMAAIRKDPPADYHMVLDGQQRIQSLLLALGGDGWGFKLYDRAWVQDLKDKRLRGSVGTHQHWSKASLCFDLNNFLCEYEKKKKILLDIDFRDVLEWAITDEIPDSGQSAYSKPKNYDEPLNHINMKGKNLIRFSRLWHKISPNPSLVERNFRRDAKELFENIGIPNNLIEDLLNPIGELMVTLRDLKLTKITYLELLPYDTKIWTEDSYNDAIVNIFTRLNTAGRTLTREEITLAWLKIGWDPVATEKKNADTCFKELQGKILKEYDIQIEMDSLVGAVSFIWSVCCNEGKLLENKDLLKGGNIRPMAKQLSHRWADIHEAILDGFKAVKDRGLEFGATGQYVSINALSVVWTWLYIAIQWEGQQKLSTINKDNFKKELRKTLSIVLDRWLICSQWAGRWSKSSSSALAGYAKELFEDYNKCNKTSNKEEIQRILHTRFINMISDKSFLDSACNHIAGLSAPSRERVSLYRTALWVWHRLDKKRWEISNIQLRIKERVKPRLEVDHIISTASWMDILNIVTSIKTEEFNEKLDVINLIGNCSLLEKTFNISKGTISLRSFLEKTYEIQNGKTSLEKLSKALIIDNCLMEPTSHNINKIIKELKKRDLIIRDELQEFIKGKKSRVDVI